MKKQQVMRSVCKSKLGGCRRLFLSFIMLQTLCSTVAGQEFRYSEWFNFIGRTQVAESWSVTTLFQQRFYRFPLTDSRLSLLGNVVEYRLKNANVQFGVGYLTVHLQPYDADNNKQSIWENRTYFQTTIGNRVSSRYFIWHRFRFDQRFLFDDRFRWRARYLFSSRLKLGSDVNSKWALALKNEIRMNLTEQPFDSNRIFVSIAYRMNKTTIVEPGAISQINVGRASDVYFALTLRKAFSLGNRDVNFPDLNFR